MLDNYIIEQIQKIEKERLRQESERMRLPLPTPLPELPITPEEPPTDRGVVVIELRPHHVISFNFL